MGRPKKEESSEPVVKKVIPTTNGDKKKAALATLRRVREQFGNDVGFLGSENETKEIESISSGSYGLDNAMGVGGFPKGRIIEIAGMESSGKTLVTLSTIAECQRNGGTCVFLDFEHSLSPEWCSKLGVNYNELTVLQPNYAEQAFDIIQQFVEAGVDLIVLDSVAAMPTKAEMEGSAEDNHMAVLARVMSSQLKKLTATVSKSKTVVIFINQIRMNVGTMYGNPEVTPGGNALKFYCSVRLRVKKKSASEIKKGNDVLGHIMVVKCVKNKVGPPLREAEFELFYESGINQDSEIAELAVKKGIVAKPNPRRYEYKGNVWTSRAEFDKAIKDDEALKSDLGAQIVEALKNKVPDVGASNLVKVGNSIVDQSTGEVIETDSDGKEIA
jgi:recombination protein RecA